MTGTDYVKSQSKPPEPEDEFLCRMEGTLRAIIRAIDAGTGGDVQAVNALRMVTRRREKLGRKP